MPSRRSPIRRLVSLWRNLAFRARVDHDVDDELEAMFELLVDEKIRMGLPPAQARRAAAIELGRPAVLKEQIRDARAGAPLDALLQDIRYGLRLLARSPVFTLTAALSLAIGIGANTTIFTIANALLFRPPAGVSEPDRLIDVFRFEEGNPRGNFTTSYPYFADVRERATTIGLFAYEFEPRPVGVGAAGGTETAFANVVTANYFSALGVVPAAGRVFSATDETRPVAVISYRYWNSRFASDAGIVGRTVDINRQPFTVIGVAPEAFRSTNLASPDLWVPMGMVGVLEPGSTRLVNRRYLDLGTGGRLEPGVSRQQAAAELDSIARQVEREYANEDRGMRLRVARLSSIPGPLATLAAGFLALLVALVSVVLVIACANVAGVLLARAAARRREIAVRIAIGAGRLRLVRQLLTETTLVFLLGGAAGLFVARVMTSLLISVLPAFPIPIAISLPLDGRVVVFTGLVSLSAALLSGLAPALHVSKADVVSGLKDDSHGPSDRMRARNIFVIAQVAFSITLVVVAGLLAQALERMGSFDQGFDPHGVEIASLDLAAGGYSTPKGAVFARDLVDRLRAAPGIEAAALSKYVPGRGGMDVWLTAPGAASDAGQSFMGTWNAVDRGYFALLRMPMLSGREFTSADRLGTQPVVIVSETVARHFWPGENAVGRYLEWHDGGRERPGPTIALQVIGVVRDLRSPRREPSVTRDLKRTAVGSNEPPPQPVIVQQAEPAMVYVPLQQRFTRQVTVVARASSIQRGAAAMRELVKAMDPNLTLSTPQRLDMPSGPVYMQLRIASAVAGSVGLVGLLLAAIGIYGVTAYTTTRRTREIGIRMAMGAQRADVVRMVLRQGMMLVMIGSAAGLGLAAAGSRLFANLLYGVAPLDPVTFGGAALLFAAIGLAACVVPARRAVRIDAMEAVRYE